MNRKILAFAAAAALALPGLALASDDTDIFPRVVGDGANLTVEYGPEGSQNTVGSADSVFIGNDGAQPKFRNRGESVAQAPLPSGIVPRLENLNGRNETVYVPAARRG